MKPCISVIVPCYNVDKYLDRCMRTLLNQTLQNIEIILVDDGSPDRCQELCDEYARIDSRVKVIHKSNAGLGYARNSGLEIATGEFIAFVDSDDYIAHHMYSSLYEVAKQNICDAVFCGYKTEKTNNKGWIESSEIDQDSIFEGCKKNSFMLGMIANSPEERKERKYAMSVWRAIYKREIIDNYQIKFFSEREIGSEDLPFNISFIMKANRVGYINKHLYYYCYNNASLASTFKREKFLRFVNLYRLLSSEFKENKEALDRCDRLIIGYTRNQILQLADTNIDDKIGYIRDICNNPIWNELVKRYKSHHIKNIFHKCFYKLMIEKHSHLLLIYCQIARKLQKNK